MKTNITLALIVILALLSLFTGFSINGNFAFVSEYAFVSLPQQINSSWQGRTESLSWLQYVHWVLLIISHLLMVLLPYAYYRQKSIRLLIWIPLFYLVMQLWLLTFLAIILMPFVIVWAISLIFQDMRTNKLML